MDFLNAQQLAVNLDIYKMFLSLNIGITEKMKERKPKVSSMAKALKFYLRTTTLHCVKHLTSNKLQDRALWLAGCCASTVCAAILCTVLWARFFRNPSVLIVLPPQTYEVPVIGVCSPPSVISALIINQMPENYTLNIRRQLAEGLTQSIRKRRTDLDVLHLLQEELREAGISLTQAWMRHAPPCSDILKKCRFRGLVVKCDELFTKEMTDAGPCCALNPKRLSSNDKLQMYEARDFNLILNCTNIYDNEVCIIFTHYWGEDDALPIIVRKGFEHFLTISYTIMQDASGSLVKGKCISDSDYSYRSCMMECRERVCGCSDPLRTSEDGRNKYPFCEPLKFNCLRNITHNYDADDCDCPLACENVKLRTNVQSAQIESTSHVIDPLYSNLNFGSASVVHLHLPGLYSRAIKRMRTESWLTLMSSLGGIFNMFMGFGLFSALEFLIFFYIRLPKSVL